MITLKNVDIIKAPSALPLAFGRGNEVELNPELMRRSNVEVTLFKTIRPEDFKNWDGMWSLKFSGAGMRRKGFEQFVSCGFLERLKPHFFIREAEVNHLTKTGAVCQDIAMVRQDEIKERLLSEGFSVERELAALVGAIGSHGKRWLSDFYSQESDELIVLIFRGLMTDRVLNDTAIMGVLRDLLSEESFTNHDAYRDGG